MSGRAVSKKRLVRTKRLSDEDSQWRDSPVRSHVQSSPTSQPSPSLLMASDSPPPVLNTTWRQSARQEDLEPVVPDLIPPDHGDTDTESLSLSSHSSVLVDMGKVVGLLRSYPLHGDLLDDELAAENGTGGDEGDDVSDFELSDETQCSESNSLCASCAKEVKGEESEDIEDSLFGDPLVYATFVATVQQYSTETEPSRQPSFTSRQPSVISRNPSFKQNSSEPDTAGPGGQADKSEGLVVRPSKEDPHPLHLPMDGCGWQLPTGLHLQGDVSEVSTADLNHQAAQERLSFIHSQESSEEPDYDQVPLPSLAGKTWEGEETARRRGKRERSGQSSERCGNSNHQNTVRRSKSRSKSRSPGREIDRAIVIVHHHTTCSHTRNRSASPDNLSESSISFHENEVNFDLSPGSVSRPLPAEPLPEPPGLWYERGQSSKPASSNSHKYSNWESCRESWFSSGSSEVRPSSGSDCPPPPPHSERSASTLPRTGIKQQESKDSGSSSSRPNSRPGTRGQTRSDSPGRSVCSGASGPSVRHLLSRPLHTVPLSRDSTPSESGCSSGISAPSASDQDLGTADLSLLDPLTEDSLIENLYRRFKKDQIYTAVSNLMVSINPYKKVSLYTPDVIDKYRSHCLTQLPPHIYSLADRAWHQLRDRGEDQAVILTGESGAGKTEAGKLVMQYIAAVTGHSRQNQDIKYQLLQANPVLEGLGNAKTLHNDNSSRFGKYIEICFDFKGDPMGGTITNYWLEKSRVTQHHQTERNFHIFYQLLAGADVHLLKELKLQRNLESYDLLWSGTGTARNGRTGNRQSLSDRRDFAITKKAMEDLGLKSAEICDILVLVAAVLKLGNIQFVPTTNMDGTEGCSIANQYELYDVSQLLKADISSLRSALLAKCVELSEECLMCEVSSSEAEHIRDGLCRTLYSRLFTYLVTRINDSIKVKTHRKHNLLGILDIYGFEAFQHNGFEQFIINYANEKLQQLFIDICFKAEQEEYLSEGVEWVQVGFFSNSVICQLMEQSSCGVFSLCDEFSGPLTGANITTEEETFLQEMNSRLASHPHYEPSERGPGEDGEGGPNVANPVPADSFRVKHYAGSVTYNVRGFLNKNNDCLERELSCVMYQANHPLLRILFPEGNSKRTLRRRPATVGTQFKISIGALLNNLTSKHCQFVRCIKPNESRLSRVFDMTLVQHQIRYLGLVELARLRRNGFCFREQYGAFLARFKMLCPHTWPAWHGPAVEGVTYLLRGLPISAKEYAFGRSKIFIRTVSVLDQLEEWRKDRLDELATLIQKIWRGWRARQNWMKLRESQIVICTYWKKWKDKSHITELKQRRKQEWAVVIIQKYYRRWQVGRWLIALAHNLPSESPVCRDWPRCPAIIKETSFLLRKLYHKWRCERFRTRFDQTARNRMREKVTASLIFKERKSSYARSICHPFLGDYVRLRQNPQWKKMCSDTNDQYVVFADIINKITRTGGKFVPILFVISTSSMLILDQRTMQIKYRVPAAEIFKLSLSPFFDDIAVFHVRASSPTRELRSQPNIPGCLSSEAVKRKGDFVFQTGHVIEIVTKLFLVVQNATGKPPAVNISTQFDANFGTHSVTFQFKSGGAGPAGPGGADLTPGHVKLVKRGNKMEVLL